MPTKSRARNSRVPTSWAWTRWWPWFTVVIIDSPTQPPRIRSIRFSLRTLLIVAMIAPLIVWRIVVAYQEPPVEFAGVGGTVGMQDRMVKGPTVFLSETGLGTAFGVSNAGDGGKLAYALLIRHDSTGPFDNTINAGLINRQVTTMSDIQIGQKMISLFHAVHVDTYEESLMLNDRPVDLEAGRCLLVTVRGTTLEYRQCPLPGRDSFSYVGTGKSREEIYRQISEQLIDHVCEKSPEAEAEAFVRGEDQP